MCLNQFKTITDGIHPPDLTRKQNQTVGTRILNEAKLKNQIKLKKYPSELPGPGKKIGIEYRYDSIPIVHLS